MWNGPAFAGLGNKGVAEEFGGPFFMTDFDIWLAE
jgi:hypothetical protein